MIYAAYVFLGVFLMLCGAAVFGGAALAVAWWYDRRRSRGWKQASDQQRRTVLEIKF